MATNATADTTAPAVTEALRLAGISPNGLTQRRQGLPSETAALHRAILRSFVEQGGPPDSERVSAEAAALGTTADAALRELTHRDLILRDRATGEITAAYPFSAAPTRHRVEIEGSRPVYAMCAIDALGIPFMLGRDAEITSEDPVSRQQVRVHVRHGKALWQPPGAIVFIGSRGGNGPTAQTCCAVINFFESPEAAGSYQQTHPELRGRTLSQAEAIEAGKQVFGNLLSD